MSTPQAIAGDDPARCYDRIIAVAAAELGNALRASPWSSSVAVWAIPTTNERKGRLVVGSETPAVPPGVWPVVVWPSDNGASLHRSWSSVPFSAMQSILWHACRRQPIL